MPEQQDGDVRRGVSLRWRCARIIVVCVLAITPVVAYLLSSEGMWEELDHRSIRKKRAEQLVAGQFDIANATVPRNEILSGGPPKDGIPALAQPKTLSVTDATYLDADDRVIGVAIADEARAYPLRILNYHEIVNDELGGIPIAVSYCPLCDSVTVFNRNTPGGLQEFGVSGLLYNSNVLMYDRDDKSESLWSQIKNEAVTGKQVGSRLKLFPLELTTWGDWQSRYPDTTVLSTETGYQRDYARNPYGDYLETPRLMFPVSTTSDRLPTKEKILGVFVGGIARAYPKSAFSEQRPRVEDKLAGKRMVVEFTPSSDSLRVVEADSSVEWMYSLWFSWYAMHPKTEVYEHATD